MRSGQFDDSFTAANLWYEFEPFSARPAIFGSYTALVGMRDEIKALELIDKARISSPNDPMLLNNQACALATLDRPDEATAILRNIDIKLLQDRDKATLLATVGLISFREGNIDTGREYYQKAAFLFERSREFKALSVCLLYRGREEARIKSGFAKKYLDEAFRLAQNLELKEVVSYVPYILGVPDQDQK